MERKRLNVKIVPGLILERIFATRSQDDREDSSPEILA
jgi:hypothetical protein